MGWHADKEPELGPQPVIASVSLGATRTFEFRHAHALALTHGNLLVMRGRTQLEWVHRVPKQPDAKGKRINLTFWWVDVSKRALTAAADERRYGRFATKSISTSASRASPVTPMQVRAGSGFGTKYER